MQCLRGSSKLPQDQREELDLSSVFKAVDHELSLTSQFSRWVPLHAARAGGWGERGAEAAEPCWLRPRGARRLPLAGGGLQPMRSLSTSQERSVFCLALQRWQYCC